MLTRLARGEFKNSEGRGRSSSIEPGKKKNEVDRSVGSHENLKDGLQVRDNNECLLHDSTTILSALLCRMGVGLDSREPVPFPS